MPTIKINSLGAGPLFDIASYARGGPGHRDRLAPAELERISRTVHRTPEVVVKVFAKGSTKLASLARHVDYIGRRGKLALETDEGERLQSRDIADTLIDQWNLDLEDHRRSADLCASKGRKPPKLAHKLVLSMPAGTPAQGVRRAASHFLQEEFARKHRYAFVLHTDEPHPHVHVLIKSVSPQGRRLRIDKCTLRRWRDGFARHLRNEGIEANATERAVRGEASISKHDAIFRAVRRGASRHMEARVQSVVDELSRGRIRLEPGRQRLLSTRSQVQGGWLALERRLLEEGWSTLAEDVHRFVQRMRPARTEKEMLAHEVLSRAQMVRTKQAAFTR